MRRYLTSLLFILLNCIICYGQPAPPASMLLADLACGNCHNGIPESKLIYEKAPDLSDAGRRYPPDYLLQFLQTPYQVRKDIGNARMPDFYLSEQEALALTLFLGKQLPGDSAAPAFNMPLTNAARSKYSETSADDGAMIFRSLNCQACHRLDAVDATEIALAPNLAREGARVKAGWLKAFLRGPQPIRSHGFLPGSGSRHPDFRLSENEVDTLSDFLIKNTSPLSNTAVFTPTPLSAFSFAKAEKLLREKLACVGCHRLEGEGGIIGPDLSGLNERLQPSFVYGIIKDPANHAPGSVMPKIVMPEKTITLISNYLLQQRTDSKKQSYTALPTSLPEAAYLEKTAASNYARYCASCHGSDGNGDGFNASHLPVSPTRHADSEYMQQRPDDTLWDGVYAGGYILNKSHTMPAWGGSLSNQEITNLVKYMRTLCDCEGPGWSRDDR